MQTICFTLSALTLENVQNKCESESINSMNKMTPDDLAAFTRKQNYTFKVFFSGKLRNDFMDEFNAFQEEVANDLIAASDLKEARQLLKNIMAT